MLRQRSFGSPAWIGDQRGTEPGASGAAEFHRRALSEPDVNLSVHPAPSIQLRRM
jgi:hypothetical protein